MARINVPVTTVVRAGVAPAAPVTGNATDNHSVANDGKTVLLVTNTNEGDTSRILTVHFGKDVDGQTIAPRTYTIPAGASRWIGPFDVSNYGRTLAVDVAHADLELSAIRLP